MQESEIMKMAQPHFSDILIRRTRDSLPKPYLHTRLELYNPRHLHIRLTRSFLVRDIKEDSDVPASFSQACLLDAYCGAQIALILEYICSIDDWRLRG